VLDQIVASIGPKVRDLRLQKGLSLQQLADRSGVSAAAIHKVERNGMVPTITTLMKLAGALNRSVSYFVEEDSDADKVAALIKRGDRKPVFTSRSGLTLENISGPYGRFFVSGAWATVEPGADSGERAMEHPGEELVYLSSGAMEFEVDGDVYRLAAGDSLHFRTDRPHRWRNPSGRPAQAFWIALRPS
jgi:transcriptional regulator with XRE-family HTH domain